MKLLSRLLGLLSIFVPSVGLLADDAQTSFQQRVFAAPDRRLPYRMLFPRGFRRDEKYPLVLFLHGAGERGDDNTAQLVHGMNDFAKPENRARYRCFVVAPQCPREQKWVDVDWGAASHVMPEHPSATMQTVLQLLDSLEEEFPVDRRRVYVTGLSMGGYGTWDLVQRFPDRFAAVAPVCGGGDETLAGRLVKVPVWAFHGALDKSVQPERSRNMIAAIEKAGGKPQYTEYPDVAHDSWVPAYRDQRLLEWLFAQRLPE